LTFDGFLLYNKTILSAGVRLCQRSGGDNMQKIAMKVPLVEMDGDEMTRVVWQQVKDILLHPFVDLKTEYFDLGLVHRDRTNDQVTIDSALRTRELGVAVKCATITPNAQRVEEYQLKEMWKSPNGTIRAIMDGTVFREPILVDCIKPMVSCWEKGIALARHAYGDVYRDAELRVSGPAKAELLVTYADGTVERKLIHDFDSPGIILGMHNLDHSIRSFARSCFNFALDRQQDLWFATKDTISKTYDHRFKDIFAEVYDGEFAALFQEKKIEYFYTLIDDAVARIMRCKGGLVWACKNYDGDVMSDMIASACGSLAMMTSVLVSPDGKYEFEAAHGTVTRHYYRYLKGEKAVMNPMATLFAWTGALKKRAELDELPDLQQFAAKIEETSLALIAEGTVTKDLVSLVRLPEVHSVKTEEFLQAIANRLA
jgi:isocitrate dehydrogenase